MQRSLVPLPADLPTFDDAIQRLGNVPSILWRGLEHAAFRTSAFREAECPGRRLNSGLSATLFRFHAIEFLRNEGVEAQTDGTWRFNAIPFLGISFYYNDLHVRILKGHEGLLPGCGPSERRKSFYDQVPTKYLVGARPMRSVANLVVLWDFTHAYALDHLWLALPAKGGLRPRDVSVFWCDSLPHPAEQIIPTTPIPLAAGDDGLGGLVARNEELSEIKADER